MNGIEKLINNIYIRLYKKVFDTKTLTDLLQGSRVLVQTKISLLATSEQYNKFAEKFSIILAKKGLNQQKGVWRKYFEAAKKLHYVGLPHTYSEFEKQIQADAVKENFKMIKTIPREILKLSEHKYVTTLIEEVMEGKLSRGSFKKQLQSHGHKNAGVIARTETAKLQTSILKNRATKLGSKAYIWLSSNDQRTRPSHRAMNGVVVFWKSADQKPLLDNMRGDAGEFPNCRCSPEPILDVDDLTKTTYKVYNYLTDKVITMNKKDLIDNLERGNLS